MQSFFLAIYQRSSTECSGAAKAKRKASFLPSFLIAGSRNKISLLNQYTKLADILGVEVFHGE
jgi:hypothetical protein